ncbi:MAG: glycosyltransferase family 4 protein [Patescibacteria group bacterium]
MRILFVTQFSEIGGTSRLHALQFIPFLKRDNNMLFRTIFIYPDSFFRVQMGLVKASAMRKFINLFLYLCIGLFKKIYIAFLAAGYDAVFIQRETFPGSIYRLLRVFNPRIVYQLEDPIYEASPFMKRGPIYGLLLRYQTRLCYIMMRKAAWVIAENDSIAQEARKYNGRVSVISAPIDSERFFPLKRTGNPSPVTIGWIGSPATTYLLKKIDQVFMILCEKYGDRVQLKVVGAAEDYVSSCAHLVKKKWSFDEEVQDLQSFDIGIMPISNVPFHRARLGGKMIFYMMVGIPFVADDAPLNRGAAKDGVHGFFVHTNEEWIHKLSLLIENAELRARFGKEGRKRAEEKFSLQSKIVIFADILKKVALQN